MRTYMDFLKSKMAIAMRRYGIACELNADYFRDGVGYCKAEEAKLDVPMLFDFMEAVNE